MKYFVIGPDGSKYGPADVDTLRQWVAEQRVQPTTFLEDEVGGARVAASTIPGLFPQQRPQHPQQPQTPYGSAPGSSPYGSQPGSPYGSQLGPQPGPQPNWSQPPSGSPYPRGQVQYAGNGQSEVTTAWIMGALSLLCCPIVFGIIGIVKAGQAEKLGHPQGKTAKMFCIAMMIAGLVIGVVIRTTIN